MKTPIDLLKGFGVEFEVKEDSFMSGSGSNVYIKTSRNLTEEEKQSIERACAYLGGPCMVHYSLLGQELVQVNITPRDQQILGHCLHIVNHLIVKDVIDVEVMEAAYKITVDEVKELYKKAQIS